MKQTAVEFLVDNLNYYYSPKWNDMLDQAKEIEKQQQGYSEEEVIKFGQWLSEFNNLDNETEYVIKELLEQFKNK